MIPEIDSVTGDIILRQYDTFILSFFQLIFSLLIYIYWLNKKIRKKKVETTLKIIVIGWTIFMALSIFYILTPASWISLITPDYALVDTEINYEISEVETTPTNLALIQLNNLITNSPIIPIILIAFVILMAYMKQANDKDLKKLRRKLSWK